MNINPADDVNSLFTKLTKADYDVFLDGSAIDAGAEKALIDAVLKQLRAEAKSPDLIRRVISERAAGGRYSP